jgi:hypothetical protein
VAIEEKLVKAGPKKLLALDGGGIRGIITLKIIERIESLLRERFADPGLVLADYFDYIAGTSTGAIIATFLSMGLPVEQIRAFYVDAGPGMFAPARLRDRLTNRFSPDGLKDILQRELGAETDLGSDRLKTLLMLVMRNASTNSPWPVSNNPRAKYNDVALADCNLRLPLWQLIRASTAAPTFFPPEVFVLDGKEHIFVDGGISVYNNPSFQLFLMATLEPYNVGWPVGEDEMLIVSVGTGVGPRPMASDLRVEQMNVLYNAASIPSALIAAASVEQDLLCRTFGKVRAGAVLDSEIGDLIGVPAPGGQRKMFTYMRYDVDLTRKGLDRLGLPAIEPTTVQPLDKVDNIGGLLTVGAAAADSLVHKRHFDGF